MKIYILRPPDCIHLCQCFAAIFMPQEQVNWMLDTLALSESNQLEETEVELLKGLLGKRCSFSFVRALFGADTDLQVCNTSKCNGCPPQIKRIHWIAIYLLLAAEPGGKFICHVAATSDQLPS